MDAENHENAQFCTFLYFLNTPSNCYLKMIEMISIVNHFYDDFPTFDMLCKSFLYKKNHQKHFNIFRGDPREIEFKVIYDSQMIYESHSQSCIETLHERRSGNEV